MFCILRGYILPRLLLLKPVVSDRNLILIKTKLKIFPPILWRLNYSVVLCLSAQPTLAHIKMGSEGCT